MTLLDAAPYDPGPARRRNIKIVVAVVVVAVLAIAVWMNRYWSEERVVGKFFAALKNKDYETAYSIYFADPQWKEHPARYSRYPLNQFTQDWGPGGQWGVINNYKVYDRAEHAQLWVEKSDNTLSLPPCELLFR
jgi:hypothetical protein